MPFLMFTEHLLSWLILQGEPFFPMDLTGDVVD